jgi:hypothetical protein
MSKLAIDAIVLADQFLFVASRIFVHEDFNLCR